MAAITLIQAQTLLDNWVNLMTKLSASPAQSVTFEGRSYTSKNIQEVQNQIVFWENRVNGLTSQANRLTRAVRVTPAW
jgi:hypothetical protein